jgi:hypothetical protein
VMRVRTTAVAFSLCAIFCLIFSTLMPAQEFRATISGTITDKSGAVIPGAEVTTREINTGTTNHTTSNSTGLYTIPFLSPGTYSLEVKADGFQSAQRARFVLQSQEHPVMNFALEIGTVSQSVTVTDEAPQLNAVNASVGQVISAESVADLPLNGRTPAILTELSAGVTSTGAPHMVHPFDNNAGNSWSIGGTPKQSSEVLLDGSPDLTMLGATAYSPTQDSVQEVSVRPFDTDASFGHTIGGVINQITKSGSNALHGTAYEFGQISGIDANTYYNKRAGNPTPVFHFNQYGLTVGGPVRIPKLYDGRNKLFFFFAWEGVKDSTPNTVTTTVPTSNELSGNFHQTLVSGCASNGGLSTTYNANGAALCGDGTVDPNQLYNPYSGAYDSSKHVVRTAYTDNQLPTLSSIGKAIMGLYPTANNTAGANSDGSQNYISNAPATDNYNNEFGRLDYNVNASDHVFFDMRHNYQTQSKNDYFKNKTTGSTMVRENFGATLDNVYTLNPTTIFDVRLNWTYFNETHGTPASAYKPSSLGLLSAMDSNSSFLQLPYVAFSGAGGSCGNFSSYQCLGDNGSMLQPTTSYQFFADVVKLMGRHSLKMGFDGRQYRLSVQQYKYSSGEFAFSTSWMNSGYSGVSSAFGLDLAALAMGLPSSGEYDINTRGDYHQYYIGSFIQDDWHVSDKLTINLGLRFDIDTPFREKQGRTVNGWDSTATVNYAKTPSFTALTESSNGSSWTLSSLNTNGGLTFPNKSNGAVYSNNSGFFSPRIGFSYSPDTKTVFRGGFGVFVQPETLASMSAAGSYSSNAISNQEGYSVSTSYVGSTTGLLPTNSLSTAFSTINAPTGSTLGASTFLGSPSSISFLAPKQHDAYSERWDFGFQRSITPSLMVEMLYVGNRALHLPVASQNINALPKAYLSTTPFENVNMKKAYSTTVSNPFYGTLGSTNTTGTNTTSSVSFSNLLVPYPQYGSSSISIQNQTIGKSYYHSAIVHVEQRAKHGLTLTANYSFSKMTDSDAFLNDVDTQLTHRISPYDFTHHFTVGGTYALPFGKGKLFSFGGSKLWDEILGGYVVNGVFQYQSGAPVYFSADIPLQAGVKLRDITTQKRNTTGKALDTTKFVTGSVTSCTGTCDGSAYINGQYVNHYRTLPQTMSWVRQDGFNNMDASLLKTFAIKDGIKFQMRFETFNTLNHPTFDAPYTSSATSSSFGKITATTSNSQPRQIQIGGRLTF